MKKFFAIMVFFLSIAFVAKSWHVITGGFRTNKIIPSKDCVCIPQELPENFEDLSIFDQEFTYLGKGCQVYVFESKDKKYVIKFLRHHKYKPPFWTHLIDWTKGAKRYKEKVINYKKSRVINAYARVLTKYGHKEEEVMQFFGMSKPKGGKQNG